MKTKLLLCTILIGLVMPATVTAQNKKWTVLVYMNADNNLETFGIRDFLEMASVPSSKDVNVIVQMDRIQGESVQYGDWEETLRFKIEKGMDPSKKYALMNLGEQNMGDPKVLRDFIKWGKTNYPAEKYLLIIWDHGDGWRYFKQGTLDEKTKELFLKDYKETVAKRNEAKKNRNGLLSSSLVEKISDLKLQEIALTNYLNATGDEFKALPVDLKNEVNENTNFELLQVNYKNFISSNISKISENEYSLANTFSTTLSKLITINTSIDTYKRQLISLEVPTVESNFENQLNFQLIETSPVKAVSHDGTDNDVLFNKEIQDNLSDSEVNIIGFDACLMSMLETAYALKGKAEYLVGSEELEPGDGWNYKLWLEDLILNPNMTPIELSKVIVENYRKNYQYTADVTLSSFDISLVSGLSKSIDELADLLIKNIIVERNNITYARSLCEKYAPAEPSLHSIDLYLLLHQLSKKTGNLTIKNKCKQIKSLINLAVVANFKGSGRDFEENYISYGSFGLAIYFPQHKAYYDIEPAYNDANTLYPVQFVKDFRWDNFLQAYYKN